MSFRTRLTSFFVLIVVVPMVAVGFLVFRLIERQPAGQGGCARQRARGAAGSLYQNASASASVGRPQRSREALGRVPTSRLARRDPALASRGRPGAGGWSRSARKRSATTAAIRRRSPPARRSSSRTSVPAAWSIGLGADRGGVCAISPGPGHRGGGPSGRRTLASTLRRPRQGRVPARRDRSPSARDHYRAVTQSLPRLRRTPVTRHGPLESGEHATARSTRQPARWRRRSSPPSCSWRCFSVLASRGLQGQLAASCRPPGGWGAATSHRRSRPTATTSSRLLGEEFNSMSDQLERRLDELEQERRGCAESIRRIGETFASASTARPCSSWR